MSSKDEFEKLRNEFEGSAAQRAGLTFNDFLKLVQATPTKSATPKATPKAIKPRGSKTKEQVGNDNQREGYNAQRDMKQKRSKSGKIIGKTMPGFKVSKEDSDSQGFDMADMRKRQRAGGKGK